MKVCRLDDIVPDTGACALVSDEEVAVFRVDGRVYALGNKDPFSGASVMSRGIVGDLNGELVVASPMYKQHFRLETGTCIEDAEAKLPVYKARVEDGWVFVTPAPQTRTTCCYCGVGCGVVISNGTVRGDPTHPANFGQLCTKGAALKVSVDEKARLLYPQIRRERVAKHQRAAWDEALDLAAARFRSIIDQHGPDSVAFYVSGQLLTEDYYVFNKLAKGLIGTNNIDTNSRLCMSSAVSAYKLAFGADGPPCCYEDIEAADLILIAGSNTAFAHPIVYRRIEQSKAKVIVVDPRATVTARGADLHLQIRPGTDVALFNAMVHVIVREGMIDRAYIDAHTEGFDSSLLQWSPLRASEVCGVPAESIVQAARMFGRAGAALSLYCMGLNQSTSGTLKNCALINLHLATGQIGRPGAGPFSLTGQPNAMGGREVGGMATLMSAHRDLSNPAHRREIAELWGVKSVPSRPGKTAVEMFRAVEDGDIKAIWIACTNPAHSMPDAPAVRRALSRAEFVVVQEAFADAETCDYADVLLPAASWAEKEGTVTNSERRISRVRAAVPPPGEARPDWEIAADFARRLGGEKLFPYRTPEDVFNEHRETTRARDLDITSLSYRLLEERGPQQWGGKRLYTDGRFRTPSGKARFVQAEYRPPAETPDGEFPIRLTTGRLRDQWHTMTRTGLEARLFGHAPAPEITLHPVDFRGFADGDLVRVTSRRGATVMRARACDDLRPGDAFIPMHWGSRFMSGAGANALTIPATDPLSRQPELKHAVVRIERFEPAWESGTRSAPASIETRRALAPLLQRFDYATLTLQGDELCVEAASAGTPPADAVQALEALTQKRARTGERTVCACFGVGETEIASAVAAGATLDGLQSSLKCGTNCGSCLPELRRLAGAGGGTGGRTPSATRSAASAQRPVPDYAAPTR